MLVVSVVIGYLLGSISSSTIISRWFAKIDIREHGSGNAGATNTLRVLGTRWAIIVLLIDVLKGVLAVIIAWKLGPGHEWVAYASGLAAIVGHNWPIFFGFRGGKGIATTIGVLLMVAPIATLIAGAAAILVIAVTRYVSLGSLILTVAVPIIVALMHGSTAKIIFGVALALLSIWRHQKNIGRLIRGQEHRIFSKS